MALGWSKTRYSPIAVDFGADSLKLLQVIDSDPPQLVAAAAMELPEETRVDPGVRRSFYVKSLKELLASGSFKGKRAICSIPAYHTLVQHLQISRSEGSEFTNQIESQLRERLNVNPSRMVVRNFRVGEIARDGSVKQEVICMAVSRDAAMKHIQIAQRVKLDVVGMHCEQVAIMNAFNHLFRNPEDKDRTICFIDVGAATTKVMIVHGGTLSFSKTIHAAGNHFTRQWAAENEMGFDDARQARIAQSSAQSSQGGDTKRQANEPEAGSQTATATQETKPVRLGATSLDQGGSGGPAVLDCLIDELKLCMRYFNSTFPDLKIEKLVFLGGESRHIATCQSIAKSLRIAAQLGDPLARLVKITQVDAGCGVDLNQAQPGWAVPFGLCLCEANL